MNQRDHQGFGDLAVLSSTEQKNRRGEIRPAGTEPKSVPAFWISRSRRAVKAGRTPQVQFVARKGRAGPRRSREKLRRKKNIAVPELGRVLRSSTARLAFKLGSPLPLLQKRLESYDCCSEERPAVVVMLLTESIILILSLRTLSSGRFGKQKASFFPPNRVWLVIAHLKTHTLTRTFTGGGTRLENGAPFVLLN